MRERRVNRILALTGAAQRSRLPAVDRLIETRSIFPLASPEPLTLSKSQ